MAGGACDQRLARGGLRERDKLKDDRNPIGSSEAQHFLIRSSDIIFRITKSLVISPEQTWPRYVYFSNQQEMPEMLTLCWYAKGDVRVVEGRRYLGAATRELT